MALVDDLFKLNVACKQPLFVNYKRHPSGLRAVGIARHKLRTELGAISETSLRISDRLIYKNYID